jgi:hypothetical protein
MTTVEHPRNTGHPAAPSRTLPPRARRDDNHESGNRHTDAAHDGVSQRAAPDQRSLPGLLRDLRDEALALVQQEFRLARAEVAQEVDSARRAIRDSVVGMVFVNVGVFTLALALAAGVYAALLVADVGPLIAGWLAPLIVGLIALMVGLVMVNRAKSVTSADHWRPQRTEQSLRETKRWAERKF